MDNASPEAPRDPLALVGLEDFQRLTLRPGDRLVLKCSAPVSMETAALIRTQLRAVFPGHEVVILDAGTQLGVIAAGPDPLVQSIAEKLDALIAALAADEDEPLSHALDGSPLGRERDQSRGLG